MKREQWWAGVMTALLSSVVTAVGAVEANQLPGGEATVTAPLLSPTFLAPLGNLTIDRQDELGFYIGRSYFRDPWVKAPAITGNRDGLGPLFHMRSCIACHKRGGRGRINDQTGSDVPSFALFLRLSLPGTDPHDGVIPEPTYGAQLSTAGVGSNLSNGGVPAEARLRVSYTPVEGQYADGGTYQLQQPHYHIENLGYGPLHPETLTSPRLAPPLVGMGLIDAIEEADLLKQADPEDANRDGISGRVNRVWDRKLGKTVTGRFGFKAGSPTLLQQSAAAFLNDIGITNSFYPVENCTPRQKACLQSPTGADPAHDGLEIPDNRLLPTADFVRFLGVPARRHLNNPATAQGKQLFSELGCSGCHTPSYVTGEVEGLPELSRQQIWPYSDFLLHDMGEGLADHRSEFEADGREWRTPPLWGVGYNSLVTGRSHFLHDGRAHTIEEAILWHGGEAAVAQQRFTQLTKAQREALLLFVDSL